jgi:hypothetical protein
MEELYLNKNIRIEYPQNRTYGECIMDEIMSIQMIDGEFMTALHIKNKPKRLSREEALRYYTHKLRNVWESIEDGSF